MKSGIAFFSRKKYSSSLCYPIGATTRLVNQVLSKVYRIIMNFVKKTLPQFKSTPPQIRHLVMLHCFNPEHNAEDLMVKYFPVIWFKEAGIPDHQIG